MRVEAEIGLLKMDEGRAARRKFCTMAILEARYESLGKEVSSRPNGPETEIDFGGGAMK